MPKSRYVSASRLRPLLVYCVVAFVALLVVDAVWNALAWGGRQVVVLAWMIAFPLGGIWVWRRSQ